MNKLTSTKNKVFYLTPKSIQSGFSLIEIMVAALILSIGILGVVGLQVVGLKGTQQSYMKQQAMSVVQNLTERMRSNKIGVLSGNYLLPDSETFSCAVSSIPDCSSVNALCSPADLAAADIHNLVCGYKTGNSSRTGGIRNLSSDDISTFIGGKLSIDCPNGCASGDVKVKLDWIERAKGSEEVKDDFLEVNTRISL